MDNALAAWPTKLSLSPHLADEIERELEAAGIRPLHPDDLSPLAHLGRPAVAEPYWDRLFP